nr:hypothetical protein [Tanacetum cinerariifolium]
MEPRPGPTRKTTPPLRPRPLEIKTRENGNRGMNLPPVLTAHLGSIVDGQPLSFPFQAQNGNPSARGTSAYHLQGGHSHAKTVNARSLSHVHVHPQRFRPNMVEWLESRATFPPCEKNQERASKGLQKSTSKREKRQRHYANSSTYTHDKAKGVLHKDNTSKDFIFEGREITFPLVTRGSNSSAPVIIKDKIFGREVDRVHMDSGSSCEWRDSSGNHDRRPSSRKEGNPQLFIVRSDSPYSMLLGRTKMKMGMIVSTIHRAIKFHTAKGIKTVFSTYESDKIKEGMKKVREMPPASKKGEAKEKIKEGMKKVREMPPASKKGVFSCTKAKEKVVINDKYPEQTVTIENQLQEHFKERPRDLLRSNADVFVWTHTDMTGIPKTIMIEGKTFKIEHKLNEYSHIKPIKQKRWGLGLDRNTTTYKEVEELMKA